MLCTALGSHKYLNVVSHQFHFALRRISRTLCVTLVFPFCFTLYSLFYVLVGVSQTEFSSPGRTSFDLLHHTIRYLSSSSKIQPLWAYQIYAELQSSEEDIDQPRPRILDKLSASPPLRNPEIATASHLKVRFTPR